MVMLVYQRVYSIIPSSYVSGKSSHTSNSQRFIPKNIPCFPQSGNKRIYKLVAGIPGLLKNMTLSVGMKLNSQQMEKQNLFQSTNQINHCYPLLIIYSSLKALMWVQQCHKPPYFLMVGIPPIKMVMTRGWFMTLLYQIICICICIMYLYVCLHLYISDY